MTLIDLRRHLESVGIVLLPPADGAVEVFVPDGVELGDEIVAAIREHKAALLAPAAGRAGPPDPLAKRSWRDLPNLSTGPRDFRKGDRWLPWHFRDGEGTVGQRGPPGPPVPRATHRHP
jgi:hypothetical protein